jgi:phosphoglycerate dehydrogenase-like enzyme
VERTVVLVRSLALDSSQREALRGAGGPGVDLRFEEPGSRDSVEDVAAIAGTVTDDELSRAVRLRWLNLWSAGADVALTPALRDRPEIILTASLGNGAPALAEHAVMLMTLLARGGWHWANAQRSHEWGHIQHVELAGQTIGLVGLGRSGGRIARIARAMDMRVLAVRRTPGDDDRVDQMYNPDQLAAMMSECDWVVVTAPLTDETRGMIGEREFRAMRPSARYINVSRGEVADEAAMRRALVEGWIAGAGLDAHHTEPLPSDSILWDLPGVIITPHNASTSTASKERAIASFADNLRRFAQGTPLQNLVDRSTGY